MIDAALLFLRDALNAHLAHAAGDEDAAEERVVLLDGDKLDPPGFRVGAVTMLVVNIQQDRLLRAPDLHRRTAADGKLLSVAPQVRLDLFLLLVARFKAYEASWAALSAALGFFQARPVFAAGSAPGLDKRIERLSLELRTPTLAEANDLWSALKVSAQPALLYRAGMIVFDDAGAPAAPPVTAAPTLKLDHG